MTTVKKRPRYAKMNGIIYPEMFSPKCFREAMEYKPKPGDIFINTYPRCGSTWMQNVAMCIFRKGKELDNPSDYLQCSPFIDMLGQEAIDKMPRPGAFKTHLPYSHLPYSPDAKYIFVTRNPKDCCVSLYHHARNKPAFAYEDGEFDDFFELFMTGELEYNDYFDHLLGWYPHRNDPNVFYTTYENMKKDIREVIVKLSKFLGQEYRDAIEKDNNVFNDIIHFSGLEYMKKLLSDVWNTEKQEEHAGWMFAGLQYMNDFKKSLSPPKNLPRQKQVLHVRKGMIGDWKNYFSDEQNKRLNNKFIDKLKDTEVIQWYPLENEPAFAYEDEEFDNFFELFMAGELEYSDYFDHLLDLRAQGELRRTDLAQGVNPYNVHSFSVLFGMRRQYTVTLLLRLVVLPNGSLLFKRIIHSRTERPDEGLYQCVVSLDGTGTIISREAKLQIASLPPFDQAPEDIAVFVDQTVYFPCSAHAVPPANITWLKNQQPIHLDETRMTILPSGALELDSVIPSDEGTYQCVAVNSEKLKESSAGTLFVNKDYDASKVESPHFIATPPKNAVVLKNSNLTLDCAANGNPKPRITWLKDGSTIDLADLDSRFRIVGSGSLSIENIKEEDGGTYMCRAVNSEDSVDAISTVDIIVPPYFVIRPVNQYAREKDDITFECDVYGNPVPILRWYKNGDIIVHSEYFQIVSGKNLRILGAVKSDSGIYQCFATNSAGSIQASAELEVLDAGQLQYHKEAPSAPENVTAIIVNTRFITLSWEQPRQRNGNILYYVVYYKEANSTRERFHNITRPHLEDTNIQGLQPDTGYVFRVVAYNQHGPGRLSKELFVRTFPDVNVPSSPNSLMVIPRNSTSVLVKWSPPEDVKEPIQYYKLHYMEVGSSEERSVNTTITSYELHGLKKFTEYTFWVTAFNKNGPGINTKEITLQTFSDKPSATPQNVSLEPASSSSIIIRWEPPPKEFQNGIITGYKIRVKKKNGNGETYTTDGSRRLYALVDLEKGAQYMVKIAALTVNGTGPFTEWKTVETYTNDLVESSVPDMPSALRARPSANAIFVSWGPPRDQTTVVRGYKIGWGIGLADVYTKVLDGKQRHYTINDLQSSSEYVISLRAFNEVGDGRPVYETVKTQAESTPEPFTPMLPPVGLKAIVLSSSTVVLYWTDSTLSRNQVVTDSRYYTVRYTTYAYSGAPKFKYFNSTDLNCMIDDLKPNTQYEFSVKVVKGRKESTWSMSVLNTTQEAAPSSPPRDLTVVPSEDDNTQINLHWQPPKQPNGHITGYVIFYTTDKTQRDRDWVVEGVVGDKMTTVLKGLTADTTYYFKIQARNNKGYGPLSSEIAFHTAPGIALASGSAFFAKNKNATKDLVPPDLWIHHDQMELKSLDKSNNSHLSSSSIQRNSQELGHEPLLSTLEKKKSAYLDSINDDLLPNTDKCIVKCRPIRATPIKISLDLQKPKDTTVVTSPSSGMGPHPYDIGTNSLGRPLYPRTQYNIHRNPAIHDSHQSVILGEPPPPPTTATIMPRCPGSSYDISVNPPPPPTDAPTTACMENRSVTFIPTVHENQESGNTGTLSKKTLSQHPMRSFSIPSSSSQSVPATPLSKHNAVKSPTVVSSPHKKVVLHVPGESEATTSAGTANVSSPLARHQEPLSASSAIQPSESTEHLNQEMANLEGLMKDLNAITASEFEC
ncbi:Netrin receptor DCC like protein [Argiope bruennichi]|uniref:Netrin receptor DCC like protein n=1 Tax=Argiope bruennichi TaxID=94029 RepID=A0A8T0DZA5_ARGBR|nr:Netrin receptor DCC like protein [Argiope bruennichi]